jgi:phage/plasmid-like protein (TIGR03299 family)
MSHEIYTLNMKDSMAYVGNTPWHGLGQKLEVGESIETWLEEAGLNWHVDREMVKFTIPGYRDNEVGFSVDNRYVLYRDDNFEPLAIVSDKFKVVQPEEIVRFFSDLVERFGFTLETAGSLDNGKRVWALAKTGKDFTLPGGDKVEGYLLLATAYDGSLSTTAKFTSVRVVCNNTLSLAYYRGSAGALNEVKVRHNSTFNAADVKLDLGMYDQVWADFAEDTKKLAKTKLTQKQIVEYLVSIYHDPNNVDDDGNESWDDVPKRTLHKILDLTLGGRGQDKESAKGTLWGAVNAVTEYIDHDAGRNQDSGLKSAWFGNGDVIKNKAYAKAIELHRDIEGNTVEVEVDVPTGNTTPTTSSKLSDLVDF